MLNYLIIASSIFLGGICSLLIHYVLVSKREKKAKLSNSVKSELDNLFFEKSIALEAINKIDQYFKENKIDIYERDRLLLKYNKLLDNYDKKVFQLQPVLEAQEIYQYRNQLYSLISDNIMKIDSKLSDFSKNFNLQSIDKQFTGLSRPDHHIHSTMVNDVSHHEANTKSAPVPDIELSRTAEYSINLKKSRNEEKTSYDEKDDDTDHSDLNLNEIDKIQKDILNTLKRLEDTQSSLS